MSDDCCPGEPGYGDPHGMHALDCPVYLASVRALEARRVAARPFAAGGVVRPSGESTSAALRRVEAELESARTELALTRRQRDTLRADLDRAQNRADAAERALTYRGEKSVTEDEASGFYEPGATYASAEFPQYEWRFRCDVITTNPVDGERTALGWRRYQGEWQPYAYGELDWSVDRMTRCGEEGSDA